MSGFTLTLTSDLFVVQLAQSVIELNNQIQQKDKEIQTNEARSVSVSTTAPQCL